MTHTSTAIKVIHCKEALTPSGWACDTQDEVCMHPNSSGPSSHASASLQGKWMYEVTLGTAGIMQLGWATAGCQFSNEEGVGDSVDSYAYDGNRVQRWNISCE